MKKRSGSRPLTNAPKRKSSRSINRTQLGRDQFGRPIYVDRHFDALRGGVKHELLGDREPQFKAAVLRVSPCLVAVVSLDLPPEMTRYDHFGVEERYLTSNKVFTGQGTIIECNKNADDDKFSTTILTNASLFIRTNGIQPEDIEVDVYLTKGANCKGTVLAGKVLACDFHYNLALVTVQMDTPVQPAMLRDLDDIMPIHVTGDDSQSFQLLPHSSSFKIRPGDKVASHARSLEFEFAAFFGLFRDCYPGLDCKELCSISSNDPDFEDVCGSPIINCHGEVIGMLAAAMTFLPSNIISRWWNYYKIFKKYCRPWLGLNVANLQSAKFNFLDPFVRMFPNVSSGIIVTKVVKDSAAHSSGLCSEDVIVQCNGATVGSTLDLFDKIWDKVGAPVELSVLRKAGHVNVKVPVDEATPVNFYRWPVPPWGPRPRVDSSLDIDSEMPESSHPE